jgi:NAD-dependent deacetylase
MEQYPIKDGPDAEAALYAAAAEAILNASRVVAVTGAGVSVESGIPDFRSAGGLWAKYPPQEYATIDAFYADPDKVWEMWYELAETLRDVRPNPAHHALAELEEMGRLSVVVTQNIDALHRDAGSTSVIEYHGSADTLYCPACHRRRPMDLGHRSLGAPRCECGGYMKPDVVLFGELIPQNALHLADSLARSCGVMIIAGTSAQVYPAAGLPYIAKENGAFIIECNTEPTQFTRTITDVFLQGPAGKSLPRLVEKVRNQ